MVKYLAKQITSCGSCPYVIWQHYGPTNAYICNHHKGAFVVLDPSTIPPNCPLPTPTHLCITCGSPMTPEQAAQVFPERKKEMCG